MAVYAPRAVLLAAALLLAPAVQAEERIDRLRRDLEKALDDLSGSGTVTERKGKLELKQTGEEIEAVFPELTFLLDDAKLVMPASTFRFTPAGPDREKVTGALPPKLVYTPTAGAADWVKGRPSKPVEIAIGRQSLTGVYHLPARLYESMDWQLGDVTVAEQGAQISALLESLAVTGSLAEAPAGVWSGAYKAVFGKLTARDPDGGVGFGLGGMTVEATYDRIRAVDLAKRQEEMAKMVTAAMPKPPATVGDKPPAKAPDKVAGQQQQLQQTRQMIALWRDLPELMRGAAVKMTLTDLAVIDEQGDALFTAGRIGLAEGGRATGDGNAEIAFALDLGGVQLGDAIRPPMEARLLPTDLVLDLVVDTIPGATLWEIFAGNFTKALDDEIAALKKPQPKKPAVKKGEAPPPEVDPVAEAMGKAGEASLATAMPALAQSKPRLRLKAASITSDLMAVDAKGEARYEPTAGAGALGKFDLVLAGLDETIESLNAAPPDSSSPEFLGGLLAVRGMAKPAPAENGRSRHLIAVEIAQDGRILANGVDVSKLMQGTP